MSISGPAKVDARAPKRRKLSNDTDVDNGVGHLTSNDSENHHTDIKDPASVGRESNEQPKHRQRSVQHPSTPPGGLNTSSILAIQLNELLVESTPNHDSQISKLRPTLEKLQKSLSDVPATGILTLQEAETYVSKRGVTLPFSSHPPAKDSKLKFAYDQPASIDVVSCLHTKLSSRRDDLVKVVVEMPKDLLQEKDYLDYRAFHKRAFYLACIAAHFKRTASDEFELEYDLEDGIEPLPGILLTPKKPRGDGEKLKSRQPVFITVSFPTGVFPLEKTLPSKSCIRNKSHPGYEIQPTPYYNSILNNQTRILHYHTLMQEATQKCPGFAAACRAGHIWLQNRGFDSNRHAGGFGLWEWATMSALLLRTGGHKGHPLFPDRYSTLQLLKAMLQVLSGRYLTEAWILNARSLSLPQTDVPVLYDGETGVNILGKMSPWSYQLLRHHAQVSLKSLNSKQEESFGLTFETRVSQPQFQFDEVYGLKLDRSATDGQEYVNKLYQVIKRGLGNRVVLLDLYSVPSPAWSINKAQPYLEDGANVELRLVLNMDTSSRLIDHGPSADDQEAATEFQRFWGDKSELRRFKDGSISESLVWSSSSPVIEQIITHLLHLHFKTAERSLNHISTRLETNILDSDSEVTAIEAFKLISSHFQTLSSTLHQLEGLPLPIRSISPTDPALRSSTAHHPLLPSTVRPIAMLIQFDSSTRWPDSLPAIQHTKIALLLKLSSLLSSNDASLTTRVGLENTSTQHSGYINTSYLDIIYPAPHPHLTPIPFRLRIHHEREISLLQTQLSKSSSIAPQDRTKLTAALTSHKRTLAEPLHTSALRTLMTRFPCLSATIRLTQSFLAAHHLSSLIPAEIIDLLCAQVFLHPMPWPTPGSATTAFLRLLHFLSRWDWDTAPIVIDLSAAQDLSEAARQEVKMRFAAWRKLDPNMNTVSWFIGSNLDPSGVVWVDGGRVEKVVASRVGALAAAAIELALANPKTPTEQIGTDLFVGDIAEFDFVLHLHSTLVKKGGRPGKRSITASSTGKQHTKFKNLALPQQTALTPTEEIGFDPVSLYLNDLQTAFGHVALFFHGHGQDVICGLWRPAVLGQREWRVRLGWSSVPVSVSVRDGDVVEGHEEKETKVQCEFNSEGVLAEMGILGEGIVEDIKVKIKE